MGYTTYFYILQHAKTEITNCLRAVNYNLSKGLLIKNESIKSCKTIPRTTICHAWDDKKSKAKLLT